MKTKGDLNFMGNTDTKNSSFSACKNRRLNTNKIIYLVQNRSEAVSLAGRIILLCLFLFAGIGFTAVNAQPGDVKDIIKDAEKKNAYVIAISSGFSEPDARQKAIEQLINQLFNRYNISSTYFNNPQQNGDDSIDHPLSIKNKLRIDERYQPKTEVWKKKGEFHAIAYVPQEEKMSFLTRFATRNLQQGYRSGQSFAADKGRAISLARSELLRQFQAIVSTETNLNTTDEMRRSVVDGEQEMTGETQTVMETRSKVYSRMQLTGLQELVIDFEEETFAFVYLSEEDLEESFKMVRERVMSQAKNAEAALERGNFSNGLKGLYKAYILCESYYKNIPYTPANTEKEEDDLRSYLGSKIRSLLSNEVLIQSDPAYLLDGSLMIVPANLNYGDDVVDGLYYTYTFSRYQKRDMVKQGKMQLYFPNRKPSSATMDFSVSLSIDISDDLKQDEALRDLYDLSKISVSRTFSANCENMFRYYVDAQFNGTNVSLNLKGIDPEMVKQVKWDFGNSDFQVTSKAAIDYQYYQESVFELKVMLNNSENLTQHYTLHLPDQKIFRGKPGKQREVYKRPQQKSPVAQDNQQQEKEDKSDVISAEDYDDETKQDVEVVLDVDDKVPGLTNTAVLISQHMKQEFEPMLSFKSLESSILYLKNRQKLGVLRFGPRNSLTSENGALLLITDMETIEDQLMYIDGTFYDIDTGTTFADLSDGFKGFRALWVQALN